MNPASQSDFMSVLPHLLPVLLLPTARMQQIYAESPISSPEWSLKPRTPRLEEHKVIPVYITYSKQLPLMNPFNLSSSHMEILRCLCLIGP